MGSETNARTAINFNNYLARIGFWGPHQRVIRGRIRGPKLPRKHKELALRDLVDARLSELTAQHHAAMAKAKARSKKLKVTKAKLKKRLARLQKSAKS